MKEVNIPTNSKIIVLVGYSDVHLFHSEHCGLGIEFKPEPNVKYLFMTKRQRDGGAFMGAGKCYANIMRYTRDKDNKEYLIEAHPVRWGTLHAFKNQKLYCDDAGNVYHEDDWKNKNKPDAAKKTE